MTSQCANQNKFPSYYYRMKCKSCLIVGYMRKYKFKAKQSFLTEQSCVIYVHNLDNDDMNMQTKSPHAYDVTLM